MAKIECVFDASGYKVGLGEGPHWDDKNQRLLWVDVFDRSDETKGKTLHIYDAATGIVRISNMQLLNFSPI
jgi:sugar lactone lactonase YvrE